MKNLKLFVAIIFLFALAVIPFGTISGCSVCGTDCATYPNCDTESLSAVSWDTLGRDAYFTRCISRWPQFTRQLVAAQRCEIIKSADTAFMAVAERGMVFRSFYDQICAAPVLTNDGSLCAYGLLKRETLADSVFVNPNSCASYVVELFAGCIPGGQK